tara:strand:- start:3 stop:467 length:465 start_codon:yes stop_codon:yes gene_type:complete
MMMMMTMMMMTMIEHFYVAYVVCAARFLKDESTSFAARAPVSNAPCKQGFTDVFVASPQKNKVFDHSGFAKSERVLAVHPTLGWVYEPPANLSSAQTFVADVFKRVFRIRSNSFASFVLKVIPTNCLNAISIRSLGFIFAIAFARSPVMKNVTT